MMHGRHSFSERSKYIPVRLTSEERTYLRLVESVVSVTDYTGKVDADFPSVSKRQNLILTQVCTTDSVLGLDSTESMVNDSFDSSLSPQYVATLASVKPFACRQCSGIYDRPSFNEVVAI